MHSNGGNFLSDCQTMEKAFQRDNVGGDAGGKGKVTLTLTLTLTLTPTLTLTVTLTLTPDP